MRFATVGKLLAFVLWMFLSVACILTLHLYVQP